MKSCSPLADMHRTVPSPPERGRISSKTSPGAISHLQSHAHRRQGPSIINVTYPRGSPEHRSVTSRPRSEEHTSELQSRGHLVCRLLLEKKKNTINNIIHRITFWHAWIHHNGYDTVS